ncbi:MAG: universal stress protein [Betaproteobacteria bacterium]|nr:universal stress protein [Betaproteobacteria bacterium]
MYKRILLAYDGSPTGQKALLDCRDVAQWGQTELSLIAVMPSAAMFVGAEGGVYDAGAEERDRQQYQDVLDEGLSRLAEAGYKATGEVVIGDPVDEIAKCAKKIGADLIVVGHRHLEGWAARWWRGSVSRALIEHAPCNVLVVITH